MRYRVGVPGWKVAARMGVPLSLRVEVWFDPEVQSYWSRSPDLNGLILTGKTLDELWTEVRGGIDELLEVELGDKPAPAYPTLKMMDAACPA